MATELVVRKLCDVHMQAGEKLDAATFTIAINGQAEEVELCPQCEDVVLTPLRDLILYRTGVMQQRQRSKEPKALPKMTLLPERKRKGKPPSQGYSYPCLWCTTPYGSSTGLRAHITEQHQITDSLTTICGDQCPLCGERRKSLAVHAVRTHKVPGLVMLFVTARDRGDEHGIVARVIEQAKTRAATQTSA